MEFQKRLILMDTEFTAWEGSSERNWTGPNEYREIIQIGCVACDGEILAETEAFSVFVRPVKNPILSDYITGLTGITQRDVDAGKTLEEALTSLEKFCDGDEMHSWGSDGDVILDNCDLLSISSPIPRAQFVDISLSIQPLLEAQGIDTAKYSSGTLLRAFGKEGTMEHNAVNDMRNFLVVLKELRARGAL